MTKSKHGHEVENDIIELPNKTQKVVRCVDCGMAVNRKLTGQLADYDCGHYQDVSAAIEGGADTGTVTEGSENE